MLFQSAFYVLTFLIAVSIASTVATVESDIATITSRTTALDKAVIAFPDTGGTVANAFEVHDAAVNLGLAIDKGTTDVNDVTPKPVAEADGKTILSAIQPLQQIIIDYLTHIVDKINAFEALPLGGISLIVKQDLINLNQSNPAFEAGVISSAPADLFSSATAVKAAVDAAFATAIAAYY